MKTFTVCFFTAAALFGAIGCDRKDEVTSYQVPKEPARSVSATAIATTNTPTTSPSLANISAMPDASGGSMTSSPMAASVKAAPTTANEIQWTLPSTWTPAPASQLRFAAFQVDPADSKLVLTIIPLGKEAADLMPNVVRWQGQIGAPPATSIEDVNKVVQHFDLSGSPVDRVDLVSPDDAKSKQRLLAVIISRPDKTWFVKLQGEAEKVTPHVEAFDAFVKSLKFESATRATSANQPTDAKTQAAEPAFAVPEGWVREGAKPMRIATFATTSKLEDASQIVVTRFAINAIGSSLDNINRWRGMMDLKPIEDESKQAVQTIDVGGQPAKLYEFTAAATAVGSPAPAGMKMVVVTIPSGEQSWFVRFVGPAASVAQEREKFDSFVQKTKW